MKSAISIAASAFLTACAGGAGVTTPAPPAGALADVAASNETAETPIRVVEVEIIAEEKPGDIVCRKTYRPGTRIVVGETCYQRGELGISAQTRDDLQRELSGRGLQAGWKSQQQIDAERSLGARIPRR